MLQKYCTKEVTKILYTRCYKHIVHKMLQTYCAPFSVTFIKIVASIMLIVHNLLLIELQLSCIDISCGKIHGIDNG